MKTIVSLFLAFGIASAYVDVDAKAFAKLLQKKDIVLLDVRTPQEFSEGHIPKANLIPLQLFRYIFLGGKGIEDKTVLVYCHSGNRSVEASKILERWGVGKVYNLKHGIIEWKQKGFPLEH